MTVIIPAYNAEAHIGDALESVARQTFDDWEVAVGDDASTDRTAEIIASFGSRFRCIRAERNLGPANGRNVAIAASSGELIATLDADDWWTEDYLEQQVGLYDREVAAGRKVGVVACNARYQYPDGTLSETTYADVFGDPTGVTLTRLLEHNPVFGAALMPREAVDAAGGFSTETWGSEDHDLIIRILELGYSVVGNSRPLYIYRQAPETVSANLFGMARTNQATYRRALERDRLSPEQRRIAAKQLRLHRAVEEFARIRAERSRAGRVRHVARAGPLLARVAIEHPRRWVSWVDQARSVPAGGDLRSRV